MFNIRFDKKIALVLSGIAVVIVIFMLMVVSLWNDMRASGSDVKALENEMVSARQALQFQKKFQASGTLLTRRKISLVIDEITKVGAARDINFLLISPQSIVRPSGSKYPVLPIRMNIQSGYQDLGIFLSALEGMEGSVIGIKSFEIQRDPPTLPEVKTSLTVEVYLKEGEDGRRM